MAPSWLHPDSLQRDDVEDKLKAAGGDNGTFLVRKRPGGGQWVLSVTYKGKPTHHLCKLDPATKKIMIMNKDFTNSGNIAEVVARLAKTPLPKGWPVPLTLGCNVDGSTSAPSTDGGVGSSVGGKKKKNGTVKSKAWLHGAMDKTTASSLLASKSSGKDGAFFVRSRGSEHPNDYVVAVMFKGKPTHHLAVKTAEGMKINNKPTPAKNIGQLVTLLRKKHPFWPVPLDEYIKKGGAGTGKLSESTIPSSKSDDGGGSGDVDNGNADDDDGGDHEWLFEPMGKPAAESKLTDAGLDKLGNFMVRARGPETPGDYVICVIYKGKPTHHLCTKAGGNTYTVNKKQCGGATDIAGVVEFLRKKQAFWPCALTEHAKNPTAKNAAPKKVAPEPEPEPSAAPAAAAPSDSADGASSPVPKRSAPPKTNIDAKPAASPKKKKGATGGGGDGSAAWLVGDASREEAEAKLAAAGGGDGCFVVRKHYNKPDHYVIAVIYRGKPTHHMVAPDESGTLTVNKKAFGDHKSIEALIAQLGKKQPGWPVALDKPVLSPVSSSVVDDAAAGSPAKATPTESSWLYPADLGRADVESKIAAAGQDDGRFLVRNRPKAGEYVVSVVFRCKPTHHQITTNGEGKLVINKKTFGDSTTIEQLIKTLSKKQAGWPVALDKPILQEVVVAAPAPAAASAGAKKSAGMPSADKEAGAATKTKKSTRDARQGRRRNPITRWAEDEQFQLWFPSHHPMYRFRDSEKSAKKHAVKTDMVAWYDAGLSVC